MAHKHELSLPTALHKSAVKCASLHPKPRTLAVKCDVKPRRIGQHHIHPFAVHRIQPCGRLTVRHPRKQRKRRQEQNATDERTKAVHVKRS